jgi:hypothetical protein
MPTLAQSGVQKMTDQDSGIAPGTVKAVEFLLTLPGPNVNVTAIHPDRAGRDKIIGRTFEKTEIGRTSLTRWIAKAQRAGYGLYFNINGLSIHLSNVHNKARESEVDTLYAFHVDADAPKDLRGEEFIAAKAALLARIKSSPMRPSLIIDSGNGFGLFWFVQKLPRSPLVKSEWAPNRAASRSR